MSRRVLITASVALAFCAAWFLAKQLRDRGRDSSGPIEIAGAATALSNENATPQLAPAAEIDQRVPRTDALDAGDAGEHVAEAAKQTPEQIEELRAAYIDAKRVASQVAFNAGKTLAGDQDNVAMLREAGIEHTTRGKEGPNGEPIWTLVLLERQYFPEVYEAKAKYERAKESAEK